jgi:hypothetical protein
MITGAILVLAAAVLVAGVSIAGAVRKELWLFASSDFLGTAGWIGFFLFFVGLAVMLYGLVRDGKS